MPAHDAAIIKAVHIPEPPEECDCFPPAGQDVMQTTLSHAIDLSGLNITCTDFTGTMVVQRSDPYINAAGYCCIDTTVVSMDMVGTCTGGPAGPIQGRIRLGPNQPSTGTICQKTPGGPCFPANSCFEIFFQIEIDLGGGNVCVFKNCDPAVMCCCVDDLPPLGCNYELQNTPVLL